MELLRYQLSELDAAGAHLAARRTTTWPPKKNGWPGPPRIAPRHGKRMKACRAKTSSGTGSERWWPGWPVTRRWPGSTTGCRP